MGLGEGWLLLLCEFVDIRSFGAGIWVFDYLDSKVGMSSPATCFSLHSPTFTLHSPHPVIPQRITRKVKL
jgi:hypothetical protein